MLAAPWATTRRCRSAPCLTDQYARYLVNEAPTQATSGPSCLAAPPESDLRQVTPASGREAGGKLDAGQLPFPCATLECIQHIETGDHTMYWDDAVIFGLATVGLMIAFMGGWIAFIVRDHHRKGKHRH